jgi:hypothetical protein
MNVIGLDSPFSPGLSSNICIPKVGSAITFYDIRLVCQLLILISLGLLRPAASKVLDDLRLNCPQAAPDYMACMKI